MPNRSFGLLIALLGTILATHPAHAQYHICWGDMHGHTAHSDGKGSHYYLRVIQADKDEHGNPSHAWSSPIWVKKR